jgi:hypothetical protein
MGGGCGRARAGGVVVVVVVVVLVVVVVVRVNNNTSGAATPDLSLACLSAHKYLIFLKELYGLLVQWYQRCSLWLCSVALPASMGSIHACGIFFPKIVRMWTGCTTQIGSGTLFSIHSTRTACAKSRCSLDTVHSMRKSMWTPCGLHMESSKYGYFMICCFWCIVHVDFIWTPHGLHMDNSSGLSESVVMDKDSIRSPYGVHVESTRMCGGV